MDDAIKPIVTVSRCLRGEYCRWNGEIINDHFTNLLADHVEFRPVCPELEIGLGVPRDPIHVVSSRGVLRLVQPASGLDVTARMQDFCDAFLGLPQPVDGFLLKYRSPSCGTNDVKIYPEGGKSGAIGKGAGFFGAAVLARFPDLAVETEGRLRNYRLREHYLTKLFTLARWRLASQSGAMKDLVGFHSRHKLLLMAYNQAELKKLGSIVANPARVAVGEVISEYRSHLAGALRRVPRYTSNINVCMHALGYFSNYLKPREKSYFLDSLERYRQGKIPLSAVTGILSAWIARFDQEYLEQQVFFKPYPEELALLSDSGKGREL
jgi:uncharacterized protein YbgA (DUF1722 family)/uncharacterized protein YbbK (DUF523 family)